MMSKTLPFKSNGTLYPLLVISLCASFLFYKYVLQIYPSIITEQLMHDFQLTGAGLGNLAATFYYAYMITQLFVGIILDKYSARWLTALAIFNCALGVILFSHTDSLLIAQLSRGLMGIGVAFATVAYMKLAAAWFAPKRYAFIGGLLASAAMAGAVFGQAPLSFFINLLGWRNCLAITGLVGLGLAFLFAGIVRDTPDQPSQSIAHTPLALNDFLALLKNPQNWLLTFYSGLAFSPIAVFGGLWGNPFLQEAYQLNNTQAATLLSCMFIGLGIGSPVLGVLSDRLKDRRNVMLISTIIACIALLIVLYGHAIPVWLLSLLLFVAGFNLGSFMLAFSIGKDINKPALTATVIAMI